MEVVSLISTKSFRMFLGAGSLFSKDCKNRIKFEKPSCI